ncbi:hypothetical protein GW17_00000979 [Ensete ventricosum]|nr:hypothetical protein GW17_00000979 [Ensete ventricosum]
MKSSARGIFLLFFSLFSFFLFLPQSTVNDRFRQYRPIVDGSRTDQLADRYIPPGMGLYCSVFLHLLLSPSLGCYRPKSATDGRFWVVMEQKQPQSVVPPGSGRSVYRSAGGPVCTARYCKPCFRH